VALYVRDALRLHVEPGLAIPPTLSEVPPDRSGLLDPASRANAAAEWTAWWATLVKHEARRHLDHGDDPQATLERLFAYDRAVHPETCTALEGTVLRAPALALFGEASEWIGRAAADVQEPSRGLTDRSQAFAWVVVRDIAQTVAAAHGIDPGTIDGAASTLLVEGNWWHLTEPCFALCSLAAATDPDDADTILRSIFESGLTTA